MIGDVPNVGSLPSSGNTQGDAYIVQADDSLHIWNGSAWISGGSIQGPTGDKGAQGDPGQKGDQGDASTVAGPKGDQGNPGDKGEQGAQGDKGETGNDSTVAGPKGDPGEGQKGETGQKGDQGDASTVAGPKGDQGEPGDKGDAGDKGEAGANGGGVPAGGTTGQALVKASNAPQDVTWGAVSGGGATKYLLRLEYDISENLITANTNFVTATGFTTAGASIVSQVAGGGPLGHTVTLNFSETNPPVSVMGYAWNPATGNYTVVHYDRDQKQIQYEVGIAAFTNQATTDGASGEDGQWGGAVFSGAQNYNITVDVDQQALPYGNGVPGGFGGTPAKLPHAYLVLTF